jgi:transposase-like protein
MTRDITGADSEHLLDDGWSTPLEAGVRGTIRGFIETLLEEELEAALGRARYARLRNAAVEQEATARGLGNEEPAAATVPSTGHRHGRRERQVMGSFGTLEVAVPAAWRGVLNDLTRRGLKTPELAIVDGAPGLEKALLALWPDLPLQRCTVHKLRNLMAHAPKRLADEIAADYADMIYADNPRAVEKRRKAFPRKWRDKCEAVATSLEEAGDKLFTFTRLPVEQWKSARTTNAIERLHLEFKRRIKTQTVLPSAETAAMLFWALLASGQIVLRKVDGWTSIAQPLAEPIDLAA